MDLLLVWLLVWLACYWWEKFVPSFYVYVIFCMWLICLLVFRFWLIQISSCAWIPYYQFSVLSNQIVKLGHRFSWMESINYFSIAIDIKVSLVMWGLNGVSLCWESLNWMRHDVKLCL
jgi:hypothetical protein